MSLICPKWKELHIGTLATPCVRLRRPARCRISLKLCGLSWYRSDTHEQNRLTRNIEMRTCLSGTDKRKKKDYNRQEVLQFEKRLGQLTAGHAADIDDSRYFRVVHFQVDIINRIHSEFGLLTPNDFRGSVVACLWSMYQ